MSQARPNILPQFFFDRLFLIRAYWNPKSRQGPGLGGLASDGGPVECLELSHLTFEPSQFVNTKFKNRFIFKKKIIPKFRLFLLIYINARVLKLQKWMPRFLANSFLALNYVFSVQMWYICLNLIDLSKKRTFCLFKTEFKAKLFARNLGIHF